MMAQKRLEATLERQCPFETRLPGHLWEASIPHWTLRRPRNVLCGHCKHKNSSDCPIWAKSPNKVEEEITVEGPIVFASKQAYLARRKDGRDSGTLATLKCKTDIMNGTSPENLEQEN